MRVRVQRGFAGHRYGQLLDIDETEDGWQRPLDREWVVPVDDEGIPLGLLPKWKPEVETETRKPSVRDPDTGGRVQRSSEITDELRQKAKKK